jgi:hypothetical protein
MNFGTVQFKSFDKVEKLITKINFNHPIYFRIWKSNQKISNTQKQISFTLSGSGPSALSNNDQSAFLTSISDSLSSVYVFTAPINTVNSNFQQSPLIVPCFYKMALNNRKTANNLTIGNSNPFLWMCYYRCCPKRQKTQRNNLFPFSKFWTIK